MTPRFAAVLVSLFLLSLTMLFGPLLLIGCDPGPLMKCDYCRTERYGVHRFICDKCTKPHAACDTERSILHYSEERSIRGQAYWSATSILTCPAASEAADLIPEKAPENPEDPKTFTPTQSGAFVSLLVIVSLLLGYGAGKMRRGQLIKLEMKKSA